MLKVCENVWHQQSSYKHLKFPFGEQYFKLPSEEKKQIHVTANSRVLKWFTVMKLENASMHSLESHFTIIGLDNIISGFDTKNAVFK